MPGSSTRTFEAARGPTSITFTRSYFAGVDGSLYAAFLLYSVKALDASYPELGIPALLNPAGNAALATADSTCLFDGLPAFAFKTSSPLTADGSPVTAFLSRPDIAAVLESLRLGKGRPDVPVLVAHTTLDDVVPFAQGRDFARSWCRNGAKVSFQPSLAPTHIGGAVSSFPKAFAFFEARVAGLPAFALATSSPLTADGSPVSTFLSRPDIAAVLESLRLGTGKPDVPVLVAHTTLDDVVPYAQGRDFARSWCRNGAKVSFQPSLAPTHVGGAVSSFPKAFAFFEARVAGLPATSNCGLF